MLRYPQHVQQGLESARSMNDRRLILYWVLLLLVTLLFGGLAGKFMLREQERIDLANEAAVRDRMELVADEVRLAVDSIQDDLMDTLEAMPVDEGLPGRLRALQRNHPLVLNTFVWNNNRVVEHPRPGKMASPEVSAFLRRYAVLFAGEEGWGAPRGENDPFDPFPSAGSAGSARSAPLVPQTKGDAQMIPQASAAYSAVQAAKGGSRYSPKQQLELAERARSTKWIPWYWEKELFLLGAVIDERKGRVYGLELDTISLLARLEPMISKAEPKKGVLGLRDGAGTWIHWVGNSGLVESAEPELVIPIGRGGQGEAGLRSYELFGDGLSWTGGSETRVFLLGSGLQILTLMLAILGLGSMLLWQAQRNIRDARLKTGFVSNVSHELKTPLTTIQMYAELLGENRVTDPDKRVRYLNTIVSESQRLGRLVNNVLDFGRLEQGRRAYELQESDLVGFVRDCIQRRTACRETGGVDRINVRAVLETCLATFDHDALEQVLLNVVDNAVKYGGEGQVDVVIESRDDRAIVKVLDCGPGVPAVHQKKIFEKFHRVDDSLTSGKAGSGLGLSIARRLMEGMNGHLEYCDRCDRDEGGACFEMGLPLALASNSDRSA